MTIGDVADRSGISAKMIRYYEEIGLIQAASRTESGYRKYEESDVHTLSFIRRARDLGFSIQQIGDLVSLWQDRERASSDVKTLAVVHIEALKSKIGELQEMLETLEHLVAHCRGDERPHCPILQGLGGETFP